MHSLIIATTALSFCIAFSGTAAEAAGSSMGSSMITMDYARYLAPIDLHFAKPTEPIKGIPLAWPGVRLKHRE